MMKPITYFFLILCTCYSFSCQSQAKAKAIKKDGKDTARVFLYGTVCVKQTKEPIEFASYALYLNNGPKKFESSVRRGSSDKSGKYKVDITSLVDSTQTLVIRCMHINSALTEIIINGRIKKSVYMDIEVIDGSGEFITTYKINPKNSKLKLVKQTVNVSTGGIE